MLHRRDLSKNSKLLTSVYAEVFLSIYRGELIDHARLKNKYGLNLNKSTWSEKLEFLRDNKLIEIIRYSRHPNIQEYGTNYPGCMEFYFEKIFQATDWKCPSINVNNLLFKYNFRKYLHNYKATEENTTLYQIFSGFCNEIGTAYRMELPVQEYRLRKVKTSLEREFRKFFKKKDFTGVRNIPEYLKRCSELINSDKKGMADIMDIPSIRAILSEESPRASRSTDLDKTTWCIFVYLCNEYHSQKIELG